MKIVLNKIVLILHWHLQPEALTIRPKSLIRGFPALHADTPIRPLIGGLTGVISESNKCINRSNKTTILSTPVKFHRWDLTTLEPCWRKVNIEPGHESFRRASNTTRPQYSQCRQISCKKVCYWGMSRGLPSSMIGGEWRQKSPAKKDILQEQFQGWLCPQE